MVEREESHGGGGGGGGGGAGGECCGHFTSQIYTVTMIIEFNTLHIKLR